MQKNIRIIVTVEDIETRGDEIFELCKALNQPIFIERDGVIEPVLMPLKYYKARGFDKMDPLAT